MNRVFRRYSRVQGNTGTRDWYLVSSQGSVLYFIAANPGCTITDISEALSLSRGHIWSTSHVLRSAGLLYVRKEARRHHFTVNLDAPFDHPALRGYTLRHALGALAEITRFQVVGAQGVCPLGRGEGDVITVGPAGSVSPKLCGPAEAVLRQAATVGERSEVKEWCCPVYDHLLVFRQAA